MKIKSWTGDEVDARVRMTVRFPDGFIGVIEKIKEKYIQVAHTGCPPSTLTMLHCPFQVGDGVEVLDFETGEWNYAGEITHIDGNYVEIDGLCGCEGLEQIRHANPSLRTSEEYKV